MGRKNPQKGLQSSLGQEENGLLREGTALQLPLKSIKSRV